MVPFQGTCLFFGCVFLYLQYTVYVHWLVGCIFPALMVGKWVVKLDVIVVWSLQKFFIALVDELGKLELQVAVEKNGTVEKLGAFKSVNDSSSPMIMLMMRMMMKKKKEKRRRRWWWWWWRWCKQIHREKTYVQCANPMLIWLCWSIYRYFHWLMVSKPEKRTTLNHEWNNPHLLKFDVSIHLILSKWGCFLCCRLFCFLRFCFPFLHGGTTKKTSSMIPQGTWLADFMKLLRGAS